MLGEGPAAGREAGNVSCFSYRMLTVLEDSLMNSSLGQRGTRTLNPKVRLFPSQSLKG